MREPRIDPICRTGLVFGDKRWRIEQECDRLDAELRALDEQLGSLASRRRDVASERLRLHRILWPVIDKKRGRQPRPDGQPALPPLPPDATWLHGRRLRGVCLAILGAQGPLALPDLHAHLHRLGFGVNDDHAAKVLAEALAYEVGLGRARRIRRGVYGLVPGTPLELQLPPLPSALGAAD